MGRTQAIHNAAGLDGMGSANYIDDMVLRDWGKNSAWTSASDGTLEERLYYLHNWRHDVSLVVTSGARIVEYAKYYSYGRPFGMPAGDCDSFGSNTANDFQVLLNWIAASAWDARGDVNSDGVLNATDAGLFPSEYMGTGVLSRSDVMNRTGYASYQHAPDLAGTKWHVRHRVLDSDLGRWTRRDPLGYVDGMGLYDYVGLVPITRLDSNGLRWCPCSATTGQVFVDCNCAWTGPPMWIIPEDDGDPAFSPPMCGRWYDDVDGIMIGGTTYKLSNGCCASVSCAGPTVTVTTCGLYGKTYIHATTVATKKPYCCPCTYTMCPFGNCPPASSLPGYPASSPPIVLPIKPFVRP